MYTDFGVVEDKSDLSNLRKFFIFSGPNVNSVNVFILPLIRINLVSNSPIVLNSFDPTVAFTL